MSQQTSIAGQPTTLLQSQGDIHESSSSTLASANEDVNDVKSNEAGAMKGQKEAGAMKGQKGNQPWLSDDLREEILLNRGMHAKWNKIKRSKCDYGNSDPKGRKCSCQLCLDKNYFHRTYVDNKRLIAKLTDQAKAAYFGEEFVKKKKKNNQNNKNKNKGKNKKKKNKNKG